MVRVVGVTLAHYKIWLNPILNLIDFDFDKNDHTST